MTGLSSPDVLSPNWYRKELAPGVDPRRPGLYEWCIEGVGCYIGQYSKPSRPMREYGVNVGRLLCGRPYRKHKPEAFRPIHRELAAAVRDRRTITLKLLENHSDKADRNRREQHLIAKRRIELARSGLRVLNAT